MLVRGDGLVIGQPAHAWVSGQLARAWGNAAFPAPAPREPLCLAAEQHDVGWADADLAPSAGPDGRPLNFMEQPRGAHVAIWRGAARRLLAQSRYAALLVSLHGTSLYERVDADAAPPEVGSAIRAYLDGERTLQSELAAGLDPSEVDRNRRLLLALDRLSLMLCHGRATTLADVPGVHGSTTIRCEPAGAPATEPGANESPADTATRPPADTAPQPPADTATRPPADTAPQPPADTATQPPADTADGSAETPARDDWAVPADTVTAHFIVDPWPFAARTVIVGCEARRLEGSYAGDAALRAALASAPWVPLRWRLSPN